MGTLSEVDGVLHADGKPVPWFEPIDGEWQYISYGPGLDFRTVFTVRPQDDPLTSQWQRKVEGEWVDIPDPWKEE